MNWIQGRDESHDNLKKTFQRKIQYHEKRKLFKIIKDEELNQFQQHHENNQSHPDQLDGDRERARYHQHQDSNLYRKNFCSQLKTRRRFILSKTIIVGIQTYASRPFSTLDKKGG